MSPPRAEENNAVKNEETQQEPAEVGLAEQGGRQHIFFVRHGDRWDYENPKWNQTKTSRVGDPPLSSLGLRQARETGILLDRLLTKAGITDRRNITWLSSPFLRCLQTSNEAMNAFTGITDMNLHPILPEYSVFEWDGKGGEWHKSLPPLEERIHYFPRLDITHQSLFVPKIPEPRSEFHTRCENAIQALNAKYEYIPDTAIVVVTHAAGCIGLSKAAGRLTLEDITPAAPCSVFQLTRTSNTPVWTLDKHDAVNSMNGYNDHLSDIGCNTVPWNHFYNKKEHEGYSGPATSKFAPASLRAMNNCDK